MTPSSTWPSPRRCTRATPTTTRAYLSARRAAIVSTAGLARLAGRHRPRRVLLLGEGEAQRDGRRRPSLLASSFEALAGALYLDLGFEPVRDWVVELADPELAAEAPGRRAQEPQEPAPGAHPAATGERPSTGWSTRPARITRRSFRIEVWVDGEVLGVGEGPSRRVAETAAAAQAMERLRTAPV